MSGKLLFFITFLTISPLSTLWGQNLFASNLYNNLVFSNPSLAGVNDFSLIQLNYKNQWPVDGIYNTYGASVFHSADELNSNIGFILNYDRQLQGVFNTINAGVNYTYKIQTHRRNHILFGLCGLYGYQELNYSNLTFENPLATTPANLSRTFPQFNAGISYMIRETHIIGFSLTNIYPFTDNPLTKREYNISYLGHIETKGYNSLLTYIEPVGNILITSYKTEILTGINFGLYNFKSGFLINFGDFIPNAVTILLGISFENYEFIYSYDLNLSGAVSINPKMAAHEVTFLRKFQYKGRRKRRGAIKCPDI